MASNFALMSAGDMLGLKTVTLGPRSGVPEPGFGCAPAAVAPAVMRESAVRPISTWRPIRRRTPLGWVRGTDIVVLPSVERGTGLETFTFPEIKAPQRRQVDPTATIRALDDPSDRRVASATRRWGPVPTTPAGRGL